LGFAGPAAKFVSACHGHLIVEQHRIPLAHSHKSESLLRRPCRENCVSRPFQQGLFIAQDRWIVGDRMSRVEAG
jgi:hypothetical protein